MSPSPLERARDAYGLSVEEYSAVAGFVAMIGYDEWHAMTGPEQRQAIAAIVRKVRAPRPTPAGRSSHLRWPRQ